MPQYIGFFAGLGYLFLITLWYRFSFEKPSFLQLVKEFHPFHGTRWFITALTSVRHLSLSWASPIQSIYPNATSWRYIVILSTHVRLGLPSGLLQNQFPNQDPIHPLSSPIRTTLPAHFILSILSPALYWSNFTLLLFISLVIEVKIRPIRLSFCLCVTFSSLKTFLIPTK